MQPAATPPARRRGSGGRILLVLFLLAAAFAGGYVPQWLQLRNVRAELTTADLQLRLANAHRRLATASHEAQRNNYASAAQSAGQFFDECATLARTEEFTAEPRTRVALLGYVEQRDPVMAMLAAADPASREHLANLYLTMDGVLSRRP
jgi:uncharacterized protein HemX